MPPKKAAQVLQAMRSVSGCSTCAVLLALVAARPQVATRLMSLMERSKGRPV
jgi:hypothetical protein